MKTLGLFKDMPRPTLDVQVQREQMDQAPRTSLFEGAAHVEILDRRMLEQAPSGRRRLYAFVSVQIAQVIEAFFLRKKYDAVLSWGEELAFPYALLCKLACDSSVPHVAMCSWPAKSAKGLFLRLIHSHIDKLILWSSVQRRIVVERLRLPHSKIAFTKYFVDQNFFRPTQQATAMICATGSEMRDYGTLVEAMRGLDIRCHIASGTPHEDNTDWAEGELPPNVTVGSRTPAELRELYAQSRFVVIPLLKSNTDNGITCILEAMAMGKTVICSRIEGQVDVIKEGETGLFVPAGNPDELRSAIQALWNNPEKAIQMGLEGRKYVESCQTIDKFVADVRSIVEEAVAQGHATASRHEVAGVPRWGFDTRPVAIREEAKSID